MRRRRSTSLVEEAAIRAEIMEGVDVICTEIVEETDVVRAEEIVEEGSMSFARRSLRRPTWRRRRIERRRRDRACVILGRRNDATR